MYTAPNTLAESTQPGQVNQDFLPLKGIDHVEFYVAMRDRRLTSIARRWGCRWWRTPARRPASEITPPMLFSRGRFGSF